MNNRFALHIWKLQTSLFYHTVMGVTCNYRLALCAFWAALVAAVRVA